MHEALEPQAIVAIIPARFGATRLPGKPLADILGRPLIQHVWERARLARLPGRVLVATDDPRIVAAVRGFGGEAVLTSTEHASGTDRVAEAASGLGAAVIVNVQGDEPLLDPGAVDAAAAALRDDAEADIATVSMPLAGPGDLDSASVVKVVADLAGRALYFSRSPVPYLRVPGAEDAAQARRRAIAGGLWRRHVGIYAFRHDALARFAALAPTPLELAEGLEQLRALEHGMKIAVAHGAFAGGPAVDTPEDLDRVRALMAGDPRIDEAGLHVVTEGGA